MTKKFRGNLRKYISHLKSFISRGPKLTVAFIALSLLADVFTVAAPAFLIQFVSGLSADQTSGVFSKLHAFFNSGPLGTSIMLLIGFCLFVIGRLLIYFSTQSIKTLDRRFLKFVAVSVTEKYDRTPYYLSENGWYMSRSWFGRNVMRNSRHLSEVMQALLRTIPDLLALCASITVLLWLNWRIGLLVPLALLFAATIVIFMSKRVFQLSKKHFNETLPKTSAGISRMLSASYTTPIDIENPHTAEPALSQFTSGRLGLAMASAWLNFWAATLVGFLFIIFLGVILSSRIGASGLVQLVLVLQLIVKASALFGAFAGIARLAPQIEMAGLIDTSLDDAAILEARRGGNKKALNKLPQVLNIVTLSKVDRFNLLPLMRFLEESYLDNDEVLSASDMVFLRSDSLELPARKMGLELSDIGDQQQISSLIEDWLKQEPAVLLIDGNLAKAVTAKDIAKLKIKYKKSRLIIATRKPLGATWKKQLKSRYQEKTFMWAGNINFNDTSMDEV